MKRSGMVPQQIRFGDSQLLVRGPSPSYSKFLDIMTTAEFLQQVDDKRGPRESMRVITEQQKGTDKGDTSGQVVLVTT